MRSICEGHLKNDPNGSILVSKEYIWSRFGDDWGPSQASAKLHVSHDFHVGSTHAYHFWTKRMTNSWHPLRWVEIYRISSNSGCVLCPPDERTKQEHSQFPQFDLSLKMESMVLVHSLPIHAGMNDSLWWSRAPPNKSGAVDVHWASIHKSPSPNEED